MNEDLLKFAEAVNKTCSDLAAQVNALDMVIYAMSRELENISPGFKHACLERVSEAIALLSSAEGAGLDVRHKMMEMAENMLRK